jgi:hypothetical protein
MMQERGVAVDQSLGNPVFAVAGKGFPPPQTCCGRQLAYGRDVDTVGEFSVPLEPI